MPACYVPGCTTGNKYGVGIEVHLFGFPRKAEDEIKLKWMQNIPKQKGKAFDDKSRICHLHFEENYIQKVDRVMMGSVVMKEQPRKHWKLTPDAIPTKFSNQIVPKYYDKAVFSRKAPKLRQAEETENLLVSPAVHQTENVDSVDSNPGMLLDLDSLAKIPVPLGWMCQRNETSIRFLQLIEGFQTKVPMFTTIRSLEVFEDCSVVARVLSLEISNMFSSISSTEDVETSLNKIQSINLCSGVKNLNMFDSWPSAYKCASVWFSNECIQILAEGFICNECVALKIKMRSAADNMVKKRKTNQIGQFPAVKKAKMQKTIRAAKARISRMKTREQQLKKLYLDLKKANMKSLETEINLLNLPAPTKSAMLTSLAVAKAKSKYAVRYSADWLLQAILLKITSPKGYRKLRSSNIVPLPDPAHLTKLLRGIPCQFGLSDYVFAELEKILKDIPSSDSQVIVLVDEMGVQEKVSFEKSTMKFKGYIDYGEFAEYEKERKASKREADHCLVVMIRCLKTKMTQPIACFATRGAAPGNMLVKILISCIIRLEQVGCDVVGVVSDGATTNKSMWRELGITTKRGDRIVNSIPNPVNESRQIYFFCDMPHILKCIRNHMHKNEVVKWSGGIANWAVYKMLYDVDKIQDLRIVPKLTPKHINPNPFQKMRVSYAAQIFSNSVAIGIKAYREIANNSLFRNTASTEAFTKTINELFDACNGRIPADGLRPNDEKFMVIKEFITNMSTSDTFASDQTMVSLQVTLTSILELSTYLCNEKNYNYALPGKFNQDPIEKFFGLVRSFGGDDSHPTAASFSHIFRLLSVYFPTSRNIKGNVSRDEDYSIIPTSCLDTLKALRNKAICNRNDSLAELEETVLEKIYYSAERPSSETASSVTAAISTDVLADHSYSTPPISRSIIYNFCGFLAFKGKTFTKCQECISTLVDINPSTFDMQLTKMKDLGGLKYPSKPLFELINDVLEPALQTKLKTEDGLTDFVQSFLESLPEFNTYGIGCSAPHSSSLFVNIILYYVTIRLWFHVKIKNSEVLCAGTKRHAKMKLAKL